MGWFGEGHSGGTGECSLARHETSKAGFVRRQGLMQNSEGAAAWGEDWHAERATLGRHFLRDMEGLWHQILKLAAVVETTLNTSVRALCDGRADLAADVKSEEQSIDRWEVQI